MGIAFAGEHASRRLLGALEREHPGGEGKVAWQIFSPNESN